MGAAYGRGEEIKAIVARNGISAGNDATKVLGLIPLGTA